MSYSNPRWYGIGNPQAFTDAFQKSFNTQYTNAIEYYEAKSKDLEEYNDSLELKAERQRQAILKSKNVTADMIKQAEQAAQDFLKESRTVSEDTDAFGAPKLIKKTKAEIDTASSAFSASAKTAGDIADIIYSEKIDLEKDLDKGGLYYDPLLKVKRALDNGNYEFKYDKNNKYSFKVKTEDGKVLDQDDLQMIIAGNDPKARKRIDEAWDETVIKVYGSTMTDLNNAITKGYASRDKNGKEIYQEEYIDKMLEDTVANMSKKTKDEFYNNELDSISDEATKAKILQQSGGKLLIDTAQEIDTKNKNNNSKEALSMLLDIPLNNVSERKRLIKEVLGEARFNEMSVEDRKNIDEALSTYRSTAIREGLKKELKSKGLKSKYIQPIKPPSLPRTPSPYKQETKTKAFNNAIAQVQATKVETAMKELSDFSRTSVGGGELPETSSLPGRIKINQKDWELVGYDFTANRKMGDFRLKVSLPSGGEQDITFSDVYNIYDPESMREFYDATETSGAKGKSREALKSDGYNMFMIDSVTSDENIMDLFLNPDMKQWRDWVIKTSSLYGDKYKANIISKLKQAEERFKNQQQENSSLVNQLVK